MADIQINDLPSEQTTINNSDQFVLQETSGGTTKKTLWASIISNIFGAARTITGIFTMANTTDSSSSTTGGAIISGGLGVAKKLYTGDNIVSGGTLKVNSTTDSSSKDTGALVVEGGVGIEKKLYLGGDLYLSALSTENKLLKIGLGRAGDGISALDLIGDATYSNYGIRLIRNAGANSNSYLLHRGTGSLYIQTEDSSSLILRTSGTAAVTINSAQQVTINATTDSSSKDTGALIVEGGVGIEKKLYVGSDCTITGAISKGSGTFKIRHPHPSKEDTHHLVHSFMESPKADLIYSGMVNLVNGQAIVNIDTASGMTDGTFELLTQNSRRMTTNESGFSAVKSSLSGNVLTITCEDNTSNDQIFWQIIAERADEHMMIAEWTDENGHVIVEPEMTPEELLNYEDYKEKKIKYKESKE